MFGIDLLTAGALLTLASAQNPRPQQPGNECPFVKTTEINIVPTTKEVRFNTSKTLEQLQSKEMDTINPYGFHGVTMTQGYMEGQVKVAPSVKLGSQTNRNTGATCIWYDKISVPIEITPVIVIAKEVYADSCMRRAVTDHEMKHVNVDRRLVNKFAKTLGQKIYKALEDRGFRSTQPVARENAQDMANRMSSLISQIVELEYKKLDLDRMEQQQAVDNMEEYNRVSQACPDFYKKVPAWASSRSSKNR